MRLTNKRYEEIKEIILDFLFDYDIDRLPINVFELAKKMKIKVVYASEILKKHPKKVDEYVIFSFPHSFITSMMWLARSLVEVTLMPTFIR